MVARLEFLWPAIGLGLILLAVDRRWREWTDRVLIPAVVTALIILVLPISHAHAPPEATPQLSALDAGWLPVALATIHPLTAGSTVRIAADPAVEPVVNFYRAQHRLTNWERATRGIEAEGSDYYLLPGSAAEFVRDRHLLVLSRDANFVLARRLAAPM